MEEPIHRFTGTQIAFMRPRARDYFFLQWSAHRTAWVFYTFPFPAGIPLLTLHRSRTTQNGKCYIHLKRQRDNVNHRIDIVSAGYYIEYTIDQQIHRVPVLNVDTRVAGMSYKKIPPCFTQPTFIAHAAGPDLFNTDHRLFEVAAPAPAPVPQVPQQAQRGGPPMNQRPEPQPLMVKLEPIPRRIAWMVAAEAEKEGEQCPITFEEISPLTAAVTTCFHCFDADALKAWHETRGGNLECPMCKKVCLTTKAYLEDNQS